MSESTIQREIMLAVSKTGARVFRNNVAEGWIGASMGPLREDATLRVRAGSVIIADARRLHAGLCVGSSDLIGFSQHGQFVAIEVKSPSGRLTEEQRTFIDAVRRSGGITCVARSVEEALEGLK